MLMSEKHIYDTFDFIEQAALRALNEQPDLDYESIICLKRSYESQLIGLKYLFIECSGKIKVIESAIVRIKGEYQKRLNLLTEAA